MDKTFKEELNKIKEETCTNNKNACWKCKYSKRNSKKKLMCMFSVINKSNNKKSVENHYN